MTKLIYSNAGIKNNNIESIDNAKINLVEASKNQSEYDSLSDSAYLNLLSEKIDEFIANHEELTELYEKTDNSYKNINDKIESDFRVKNTIKITKREKII